MSDDSKPTPNAPISAAEVTGEVGADTLVKSTRVPTPPPTNPHGLPTGDQGTRELLLAFRADWEVWKADRSREKEVERKDKETEKEWRAGVTGSLKMVQSEIEVLQSDITGLKNTDRAHEEQLKIAIDMANNAHQRAVSAETSADAASQFAGRVDIDHKGSQEAFYAALNDMKGQMKGVTDQIGVLITNDGDLKKLIVDATQQASKQATQESMVSLLGKNPKFMAAVVAFLMVLTTILSQRFLLPPGAPNQGIAPAPTPTVHVVPSEQHP